jgi:soluble lytic murein transglycosylase-like protein
MLRVITAAFALVCATSCTPALAFAIAEGANGASPARVIHAMVTEAAFSAGVPSGVAHAVIRYESKYRPHIRGRAGEWGLGQIKCQTARGVGFRGACAQLADAAENLRWSMAYLRLALDRGGSGCAGVSLYQMGVFARPRCTAYGRKVLGR